MSSDHPYVEHSNEGGGLAEAGSSLPPPPPPSSAVDDCGISPLATSYKSVPNDIDALRTMVRKGVRIFMDKWKVSVPAALLLFVATPVAVVESGLMSDWGSSVTVGVYYYPWYGNNFHGGGYVRGDLLDPAQYPELGEYNDKDMDVISKHLSWSQQAKVDLWAVSWWGEGSQTDSTIHKYILNHPELPSDLRIAIHYETLGLTNDLQTFDDVASQMSYLAARYFDHSNYYRIKDRPVIFVYEAGTAYLQGSLSTLIAAMKDGAKDAGYDIYVIADGAYGVPGSSTSSVPIDGIGLIDALTCYDTYGAMGATEYAGGDGVSNFYSSQSTWRNLLHKEGKSFVPAAAPGFDDTGIRDGHPPLSRKLTETSEYGSLFRAMLDQAVKLVDKSTGGLFMVVSFNEWHEDTQIEPVAESDVVSVEGYYGLEYEAYGERYLDILAEYSS